MKLKVDARAALTVGPNLCKDKVMQAAGRMRQLEKGRQTIAFVGTPEVERQSRSSTVLRTIGH